MRDDEEDWFECDLCDLVFTVTVNNDRDIMSGEPFVCFCPRCGSAEIFRCLNLMLDGDPLDILAYMDMRDRDDDQDDDITFINGEWKPRDEQSSANKSSVRQILKARRVAGSVVVSLPKPLRDPLGIGIGDHLMISLDKRNNRLVITKE